MTEEGKQAYPQPQDNGNLAGPRKGNYDFPNAEKPVIYDTALSRPRRYQSGAILDIRPATSSPGKSRLAESPTDYGPPRWRLWDVRTILFSVVLVIGLLSALAFLLPGASITLVPRAGVVNQELTLIMTLDPTGAAKQSGPPSIPARLLKTVVAVSGTAPVRESRTVPDGTAKGTVTITNPGLAPISVPVGTPLGPVNGVQYFTVQDVAVPAAGPAAGPGSADVAVAAGVAGSLGNLSGGDLRGDLAGGLSYSNSTPIAGGTERRVFVVSSEDQNSLRAELENRIRAQGPVALKAALGPAQELLEPSVTYQGWKASFDKSIGDEATGLHLTLQAEVAGFSYRAQDLEKKIQLELEGEPSAGRGLSAVIVPGSIKQEALQVLKTGDSQIICSVRVSADQRYQLNQADAKSIQVAVAGKSIGEAQRSLQSLTAVKSFRIEKSFDWLSKENLPLLRWRISVLMAEG